MTKRTQGAAPRAGSMGAFSEAQSEAQSEDAWARYSRHLCLEEVGAEGQAKLLASKVLIVGLGGLGSPIAYYLAAAGVGTLGLADGDAVELSNLQRQIMHTTAEIGLPKVVSAQRKIQALNPHVQVVAHHTRLNASNILQVLAPYEFVIDGTDNFAAKFLINDACVLAGKPYSHGGVLRFEGQTTTIRPRETACYACLFDAPPQGPVPNCASAGLLGAVAGMLGTIQATEALKVLTGVGQPLYNTLLGFDAKRMRFRKLALTPNPHCRVCSIPGIQQLADYAPDGQPL